MYTKKNKVLIWDFDGTIANSFDVAIKILLDIQKNAGYNYSKEELRHLLRNNTYKELFEKFNLSKIKQLYIMYLIKKDVKKYTTKIKPYPHIIESIHELSKTHDLFLLTSNKKENVEPFLEKHNINIFKHKQYNVGLLGKKKKLSQLIKKFNLQTTTTYYIGDEVRDYESSYAANLNPIIVSWGFNSKNLLKKHNIKTIIDSPKELLDYFKNN